MKNDSVNKEKKTGSPIFILIMFIVIIVFVIYIPDIYQRYNTQLAEIFGIGSKNAPKKDDETTDNNKSVMSDYYQLGSNSTLTFNDITISNVKLQDNILYLTINTNTAINLDELNYYLEFYKEKKQFLGRRTLKGTIASNKDYEIDVSNLDVTTTTYMTISHIDESVIPNINLRTDESGLGAITCTKNGLSYNYMFHLDNLIKVTKQYSYTSDDLKEYSTELTKYKKLTKEYENLSGITATIAESNNAFIYTLELDYENIENFRIDEDYKFNKNAKNGIVEFKMEAEGFECE